MSRIPQFSLVLLLSVPLCAADGGYTFTTIDSPDSSDYTGLTSINDRGDLTGCTAYLGFALRAGEYERVALPGYFSCASGINNRGEIVGSIESGYPYPCCGWTLYRNVYERMSDPAGARTAGSGINDAGDIVGLNLLRRQGEFLRIDHPGVWYTDLNGINNRGQIVGSYQATPADYPQSFLWENGKFTELTLPGAVSVIASGINDRGQIVGIYQSATAVSCFVLDGEKLTLIDMPGAGFTYCHGINNRGEIAGSYYQQNQQGLWNMHGLLIRPK